MTIAQLRDLCAAQPFRPFVMHLADGRRVAVGHPEVLAAEPGGRAITVHQPDDTMDIVDLISVTDLEIKSPNRRAGEKT
jgi:hypothetical protein